MSKSLSILALCLLLLSHGIPALADGYDDCINGCNPPLAPCIDQVRLTAGNIQEEEDGIAACQKNKANCIQGCRDAEASPEPPPPTPEQPTPEQPTPKQPTQVQPTQVQPPVDFDGGIKSYDGGGIKTYEFK